VDTLGRGRSRTINDVIEILLARTNGVRRTKNMPSVGYMSFLQREINAAIGVWRQAHEVTGLIQYALTLEVYGLLDAAETEQIIKVLQGE
jgi:hypothetical protein